MWGDGQRQVRLARLLGSGGVEVVPLDDLGARAAGQLCGITGASDVIDATVVLCARARSQWVVTSDPDDLHPLDPHIDVITC